jgi:hypothetical protein
MGWQMLAITTPILVSRSRPNSRVTSRHKRSRDPHNASSSSKALACFKSSVSKPSVNHP